MTLAIMMCMICRKVMYLYRNIKKT